jgi:hypothetical protein
MRALSLDDPRIRFNWGFHDGAHARRDNLKAWGDVEAFSRRHFDRVYGAAYLAGYEAQRAGTYTGNSDAAWQSYRPARKAA